jgi:hypothetical protein
MNECSTNLGYTELRVPTLRIGSAAVHSLPVLISIKHLHRFNVVHQSRPLVNPIYYFPYLGKGISLKLSFAVYIIRELEVPT